MSAVRLWGGLAIAALLAAAPARAEPPAYILVDPDRGTVLAENDADVLWYPASLSKLMTAYVTFAALQSGRLKATSPVTVSKYALDQPASKMGFRVGTVMTVDNALKMMMVKSANDIAVALAEAVGGSEPRFVASMNETAQRLGMVSTHYNNPNGLPDPRQVTTARDLAVLADAIWSDFPDYRSYLGISAIKSGKVLIPSGNLLLERYRGANGMKTGFICASGYNLIASATRDDRTLIAVVLGGSTSMETAEHAASLLTRGFSLDGGERLDLASLTTAVKAPPVDMRAYGVCKDGVPPTVAASVAEEGAASALGPRFVLMQPVVVTTGGADARTPAKPTTAAAASRSVPLPRLRPAEPLRPAALAPDPGA
jgi:D-alanyl-D-alanine carboxypeptidase